MTVRSPQDIKICSNQISQLFLAFSTEAGALNCISLFLAIFWCHIHSLVTCIKMGTLMIKG